MFDVTDECHALELGILCVALSYLFACCFILCDGYFIPSLSFIGHQLSLSSDIQGATLMAMGSSTPELFTSLIAIFLYSDDSELNPAPSTIVGSAMFNASMVTGIYVIIGNTCSVSAAAATAVDRHHHHHHGLSINAFALHRDVGAYVIAVIALYIFYDVSSPQQMSGSEGVCLVLIWVAYVLVLINSYKCQHWCRRRRHVQWKHPKPNIITKSDAMDTDSSQTAADIERKYSKTVVSSHAMLAMHKMFRVCYGRPIEHLLRYLIPVCLIDDGDDGDGDDSYNDEEADISSMDLTIFPMPTAPAASNTKFNRFLLIFCLSLVWMSVLTYLLLRTVTSIGECLRVSASVMGMTVIAIGSSLPDILSAIILARKYGIHKLDMIISNCFSSNTFNIGFVLGMTFIIKYLLARYSYDDDDDEDPSMRNHAADVNTADAFGLMLIQILAAALLLAMLHCNQMRLRLVHGLLLCLLYSLVSKLVGNFFESSIMDASIMAAYKSSNDLSY